MVNILGELIMDCLLGWMAGERELWSGYRLLLMVGFCGGFTTFSAFSADVFTLISGGHYALGLLYILGSILLGVGALVLGSRLGGAS